MKTSSLLIAALAAVLLSTSAIAAEAIGGANVRSGPGTSYAIVDHLTGNEGVTVERCSQNGWCFVTHAGPDGWVSATLLADNGNKDDFFYRATEEGFVARAEDLVDADDALFGGDVFANRERDVTVRFGFADRFMRPSGRPNELVCLVTFMRADDVDASRDADVQRAQILPRQVAGLYDRANDRRAIFDYGTNRETVRTCRSLDRRN
jgi:hypothetical protein